MRPAVVVGCFLAVGCGSSDNGGPGPTDSGSAADVVQDVGAGTETGAPDAGVDAGYPASHPPMPRALSAGGPVMSAPKIVAITFAGDPLVPSVNDFIAKIFAATDYWSGVTSEYGVGPIASVQTITLNVTPAQNLADSDVQAFLAAELGAPVDAGVDSGGGDAGGDASAEAGAGGVDAGPGLPPPDANTEYVLFYPAGVSVTLGNGISCEPSGFLGYHGDFALGGGYVSYAVIPRCSPQQQGVSQIDLIAATSSHEMAEAATDPLPLDQPAWVGIDPDHVAWGLLGGTEIGDLCEAFPDSFYKPADLPYLVQRMWSNAAAAAGHDPCEPNGSSPYLNSAPVLSDTITGSDPRVGQYTTKGVKIPVGESKVVTLDLYSDAPAGGPWNIQAIDIDNVFLGGPPELSFSFDKTQGQNGDTVQMTIRVIAAGQGNVEPFWIQSALGNTTTVWIGLVGN